MRKALRTRQLERPRHRWENNIKIDLQKYNERARTGMLWLRIRKMVGFCGHGNEPLWFYKIRGNCWTAEELLASQDRLCCMELFS